MGVKERREREKTELRTKIMDAARELFVRDGYENTSMRKIAEAIEYSATAIYQHFEDKMRLLKAICWEDFEKLAMTFAKERAAEDPIEQIKVLGRGYARFGLSRRQHYRLMFMTPIPVMEPTEEELARKGDPTVDAYAVLKLAVERALAEGRLREDLGAELIAQTLWASVHGVVSLEIVLCNDPWMNWEAIDKRIETMLDAVLKGLQKEGNAS